MTTNLIALTLSLVTISISVVTNATIVPLDSNGVAHSNDGHDVMVAVADRHHTVDPWAPVLADLIRQKFKIAKLLSKLTKPKSNYTQPPSSVIDLDAAVVPQRTNNQRLIQPPNAATPDLSHARVKRQEYVVKRQNNDNGELQHQEPLLKSGRPHSQKLDFASHLTKRYSEPASDSIAIKDQDHVDVKANVPVADHQGIKHLAGSADENKPLLKHQAPADSHGHTIKRRESTDYKPVHKGKGQEPADRHRIRREEPADNIPLLQRQAPSDSHRIKRQVSQQDREAEIHVLVRLAIMRRLQEQADSREPVSLADSHGMRFRKGRFTKRGGRNSSESGSEEEEGNHLEDQAMIEEAEQFVEKRLPLTDEQQIAVRTALLDMLRNNNRQSVDLQGMRVGR